MLRVQAELLIDTGSDFVPALALARELENQLSGISMRVRSEDGPLVAVVIDDVTIGDFEEAQT